MEAEWRRRVDTYGASHRDMATQFARSHAGALSEDWETILPIFTPDSEDMATRDAGGLAMNALAAVLPNLVGGSADLDPSTRTVLKGCGDFEVPRTDPRDGAATQGAAGGVWGYAGRNIHFGLREHAMAAVMTGMACHGGVLPFGATFPSFSDYMRPSIQLAALRWPGTRCRASRADDRNVRWRARPSSRTGLGQRRHSKPRALFGPGLGSAMPLVWAHAEYLKLCRSRCDGRIFDQPPHTVERYIVRQTTSDRIIWRFNNKARAMPANRMLRVETLAPAVVHWSVDEWRTVHDTSTRDTTLGVHVTDLETRDLRQGDSVHFTFYWPGAGRWEGIDFQVCLE